MVKCIIVDLFVKRVIKMRYQIKGMTAAKNGELTRVNWKSDKIPDRGVSGWFK